MENEGRVIVRAGAAFMGVSTGAAMSYFVEPVWWIVLLFGVLAGMFLGWYQFEMAPHQT